MDRDATVERGRQIHRRDPVSAAGCWRSPEPSFPAIPRRNSRGRRRPPRAGAHSTDHGRWQNGSASRGSSLSAPVRLPATASYSVFFGAQLTRHPPRRHLRGVVYIGNVDDLEDAADQVKGRLPPRCRQRGKTGRHIFLHHNNCRHYGCRNLPGGVENREISTMLRGSVTSKNVTPICLPPLVGSSSG